MMLDLKEPYTCLLWQRLHCPLAAFGTLWGEVVTKGKTHLEQSKQSLEAIEHLPVYFGKLSSRNSLAAKLESITERIVQHARSILYSQGKYPLENHAIDAPDTSVCERRSRSNITEPKHSDSGNT